MKSCIVSACVASLLVAVVIVQANYYNPRHSNYPANHANMGYGNHHGSSLGAGSGVGYARGCYGHNCNSAYQGHQPAHGPYHSYAVRPAVYGGQGLYKYRGYARYPASSSQSHYRQVRSCSGYNCNRGSHGSSYSQLNYNLRPINALVVKPVYRPSSHNYRHASRHSAAASGYGRGTHSSSYRTSNSGSHYAKRHPVSAGY